MPKPPKEPPGDTLYGCGLLTLAAVGAMLFYWLAMHALG